MKILKYKDKNGEYQELYDIYTPEVADPFNGYKYVDMGEAGIWCTHNIGADIPERAGDYFGWGGIKPIDIFSTDEFDTTDYSYQDSPLKNLPLEYDTANRIMGGDWIMPSKTDIQKLVSLCNITSGNNKITLELKTDESKQLVFPNSGIYKHDYNSHNYNKLYDALFWLTDFANDEDTWPYYVKPDYSNLSFYNNCAGWQSVCPVRGFIPKQ